MDRLTAVAPPAGHSRPDSAAVALVDNSFVDYIVNSDR